MGEFIYSHFKGSCFFIKFFGKIDKDFRAIAIIGEADNDNIIFKVNLEELDKNSDLIFLIHNINEIFTLLSYNETLTKIKGKT